MTIKGLQPEVERILAERKQELQPPSFRLFLIKFRHPCGRISMRSFLHGLPSFLTRRETNFGITLVRKFSPSNRNRSPSNRKPLA
eukprot:6312214-Amphidinium_carterae.2